MGYWKKAAPVVQTALIVLTGFVAGDFVSRGLLYRQARSLWHRNRADVEFFRRAVGARPVLNGDGGHDSLQLVARGHDMERALYSQCPSAVVKVMDDHYVNVTESLLHDIRSARGISRVSGRNMCEIKGDCDEAARIMIGWTQQRYPAAAVGFISGKLKNGRCHAEVVFWNGAEMRTYSPRKDTVHDLDSRFSRVYFLLL